MSNAKVVLSGLRSDSHTWGLAYLQLWLEERGFTVCNVGCCVTPETLTEICRSESPALVVLTSVNGHGADEGREAIAALQAAGFLRAPVVIGGKLTISVESDPSAKAELMAAGYAGVFTGPEALDEFDQFIRLLGLTHPEAAFIRAS